MQRIRVPSFRQASPEFLGPRMRSLRVFPSSPQRVWVWPWSRPDRGVGTPGLATWSPPRANIHEWSDSWAGENHRAWGSSAMMAERELECADCGATFVFSELEQERYAERGFAEPKRCPACRAARRAARSRRDRPRAPRRGGPPPRRQGGGRPQQQRRMWPIVCHACGREAEVPFEPAEDRPVYCPECHRGIRQGEDLGSGGPRTEGE